LKEVEWKKMKEGTDEDEGRKENQGKERTKMKKGRRIKGRRKGTAENILRV